MSVVATNVAAMNEMIMQGRHVTNHEIQASLDIDMKAIYMISFHSPNSPHLSPNDSSFPNIKHKRREWWAVCIRNGSWNVPNIAFWAYRLSVEKIFWKLIWAYAKTINPVTKIYMFFF